MSTKAKAHALVEFRLELELAAPWGDDATVGQVNKQARADALQQLTIALQKALPGARVKGEPRVTMILVELP